MTTRDELEKEWSIRGSGLADDLGDYLRAWAVANGLPYLEGIALDAAHKTMVAALVVTAAELSSFGFDDDAKAEEAMLDLFRVTRDGTRQEAREGMN